MSKININIKKLIEAELVRRGLTLQEFPSQLPEEVEVEGIIPSTPFEVTDALVKFFYRGDGIYKPDIPAIREIVRGQFYELTIEDQELVKTACGLGVEIPKTGTQIIEVVRNLLIKTERITEEAATTKAVTKIIKSLKTKSRDTFCKKYKPSFADQEPLTWYKLSTEDFAETDLRSLGKLYTMAKLAYFVRDFSKDNADAVARRLRHVFNMYSL